MSSKEEDPGVEAEESLLYSARHGELSVVKALLDAKKEGKLTLDINCKGGNSFSIISLHTYIIINYVNLLL